MSKEPPEQLPIPADPSPAEGAREYQPVTVTQLVRWAARHVEKRFSRVWVEGEVSNLKRPSSGHLYFTLKDRQSQIAVVMFRSAAQRLKVQLEPGQTYRVHGKLTIYEPQGRFQLTAERVEVTGVGELLAAIERLKRKLAGEGLFDAEHKQPLPVLPRWVVVVTSRSGAALRDILRVLETRWPVRVTLCPASVQGRDAPWELCEAMRRADALGADVLIVGRGGGSPEDLQAFNHERVARTLFTLKTPTISAVGHEIDVTIADLVADARAATPSAAAERAVPPRRELEQRWARLNEQLSRGVSRRVERAREALARRTRALATPERLIDRRRQLLDERTAGLERAVAAALRRRAQRLQGLTLRLAQQEPSATLARKRSDLDGLMARLLAAWQASLQRRRLSLGRAAAALSALSPLSVLARGYSIVHDSDGGVLRDARATEVGAAIDVRLHRGRLRARVERVEAPQEDDEGIL
jgi:exodeoxyribonuclease VII large subunit